MSDTFKDNISDKNGGVSCQESVYSKQGAKESNRCVGECGQGAEEKRKGERVNPFFEAYDTPHGTVPFNKIRLEDYEEAFMEGIRRDNELLSLTINNKEKPTFDNTILNKGVRDDGYYNLLDRVSTVFFNLLSCQTNDAMDALAEKMQPILTKHANDMSLNKQLFERVKAVHLHHRRLTAEEKRLLDSCYEGFTRSGALLNDSDKERLRSLTEEASVLALQFSQNLLKETKAFTLHITEENDLAGLPESAVKQALMAARESGKSGWLFTLDMPSYSPFMTYAKSRELRRRMYMAHNTLCAKTSETSNLDVCQRLVNLRREIAQLLGFKTFADYKLKHRMAGSKANVYKLLDELLRAYKPTAEKEVGEVVALAKRTEGKDFVLMPWDFSYFSHKLQLRKYNIDAEMLRPYFELDNVIHGVFSLATTLYGITFKQNTEIETYDKDVKAYEVSDGDGSYLGVLYADFHPRKGKQQGAWMTEYQGQWINRKGENVRPHVSLVMNLTKPTEDKPALLTLSEVETFLHEFGHALHGLFANTRFESLSGTNVWWDFVELPSQFMENYSVERDFLRTFAFNHETKEPLPDDLINKVKRSRNFLAGYSCLRQVSFGLLDMAYYTLKEEFKEDLFAFERNAWKSTALLPKCEGTLMTTQFSHIMAGGYAAGYYSYKWAEVLEADAFSVFQKEGIFNRQTAQRFRQEILSKGGTEHPMTLYKRFRGKEPTVDALLRRNGIKRRKKTTQKR